MLRTVYSDLERMGLGLGGIAATTKVVYPVAIGAEKFTFLDLRKQPLP